MVYATGCVINDTQGVYPHDSTVHIPSYSEFSALAYCDNQLLPNSSTFYSAIKNTQGVIGGRLHSRWNVLHMSTAAPARAPLTAPPHGTAATRCPALLAAVDDGAEREAAGAVVAVTGEVGSVEVWAAAIPEEKADAAAAGLLSVSLNTVSMR